MNFHGIVELSAYRFVACFFIIHKHYCTNGKDGKRMAIRKRNIVLRVPVTAEKRALIALKIRQMGTGCFAVYARKMLIDGYVVKMDYSDVKAMTDIENCIKAQQSADYERWAKIENLKRAARTMAFLDQNGIEKYADLEHKITELQDTGEKTTAALKGAERRLSDLALLIKNMETYRAFKPLYEEYKKSRDKEKYLRGHEREIILFEAAAKAHYLPKNAVLLSEGGTAWNKN